jgi:S1-C subfamily serine protease
MLFHDDLFSDSAKGPQHLPPPDASQLDEAIALATRSTVKIEGSACDLAIAGSGVVVGEGMVMTAAHVVAGASKLNVIDPVGRRRSAAVIVVDPLADLAVLSVSHLDRDFVNVSTRTSDRGLAAAVLGYPRGGSLAVQPGVVLDNYRAQQHDIYGRDVIERQVLEVQAPVEPGQSGGPVVDATGSLVGIIFGQSEIDADVAYAVTAQTIAIVLREGVAAVQHGSVPVSTGECLPSTATS